LRKKIKLFHKAALGIFENYRAICTNLKDPHGMNEIIGKVHKGGARIEVKGLIYSGKA